MSFDNFWRKYPRKVARKVAMQSFAKLPPDEPKPVCENEACKLSKVVPPAKPDDPEVPPPVPSSIRFIA